MKKMTIKSCIMDFVKGMEECRDAFPGTFDGNLWN